jgi:hypothetical protein
MATNNGLEIKVGADVQGAVSGINTLNKSLATLPKASGQATTSLTNFSRVVQDAPFGIIGVANNIDPLIQSFIGLRKETGSAKAAFAALGSSLIGGGGLALAISLVTSGLVLFAQSKQKAASEAKKLKEEEDVFVNTLAKERTQLDSLFSVATNANVPLLARKEAIKDLRANYGAYLKDFSDEEILAGKAAVAYDKLATALINVARARAAQAKQQEITGKILDNEQKIADIRAKAQKDAPINANKVTVQGAGVLTSAETFAQARQNAINETFRVAREETNKLREENKKYEEEIKNLADVIIKNQVNPLKEVTNGTKTSTESTKNNTAAVRENLNTRAELNGALERSLQLIIANKEAEAAFAKEVLRNAPKQKPGSQLDFILSGSGYNSTQLEALQGVQDKLIDISGTINNGLNAGIDTFFNAIANNQDPFKALAQSAARLVTELAAAVVKALVLKAISQSLDVAAPGAGRAFEAFGNGLTGGNIVRSDFLRLATLGR